MVNAAKAGDTKAVEEQRKKWYANAKDIANFLGDINPYWSTNEWQALLNDHLQMTENEAIDILSGKYRESIFQYDEIQNQALTMADVMSDGIVKQFQIK